jgi:hypothetical protein
LGPSNWQTKVEVRIIGVYYEFEKIKEIILTRYPEIQISYNNQLYWIIIGDEAFFGDIDGLISLKFSGPKELLNSALVDGKKLDQIWNDVEVESFEG